MTLTRMSMGRRIVELLRQEGVQAVFSQGDITTRDVLLHAERAGMHTVGPRHEASAVFAAMGYYAVTGRPQAAFGAMGPGVANLLPAAVAAGAVPEPGSLQRRATGRAADNRSPEIGKCVQPEGRVTIIDDRSAGR